jgi:hypothetical protein
VYLKILNLGVGVRSRSGRLEENWGSSKLRTYRDEAVFLVEGLFEGYFRGKMRNWSWYRVAKETMGSRGEDAHRP